MKTLALGMPPIGIVAHISDAEPKIPDPYRATILAQFDAQYPGVYLLAAFDATDELFALMSRTREVWFKKEKISAVIVAPTLPAKGSGGIEIAFQTDNPSRHGMIWVPGYNEVAHRWMKEKALEMAALVGCSVREEAPLHDA